MAAAVIGLLATSNLFGMTVTAAASKPADMTENVAPVTHQPPSEAEKASGVVITPVSQPSELVRGGVNTPPAALVITGVILFVAGSALLLLRRRQPYD